MVKNKLIRGILVIGTAAAVGSGVLPAYAQENPAGLKFGSGKYAEIAAPLENIPDTVEVRANLTDGTKERQILFGNYQGGAEPSFSLELTADGKLRYFEDVFENGKKMGNVDARSEEPVKTGAWTQFSVVRDAENNTVTLYQDGEALVTKQSDYDLQEEVELVRNHFIGADNRKKYYLNGEISQVTLWNEMRTAEELGTDAEDNLTGTEKALAHCWKLSEEALKSNVVEDLKGGPQANLTGFYEEGPVYEKEGTDFSGGIERMDMAQSLSSAPLTVEAWIRMPASSAGGRGGVICGNYYSKYYTGIPLFNFEVYSGGNPRLYYVVDGKEYQYIVNNVNVCRDQWVHLAMSYDTQNKEMRCYINGELQGAQKVDFHPQTLGQPLTIGRDSRDSMNFKGEIADLRIWSVTRSEEEVRENFDRTLNGDEEGLMANFPLKEIHNGVIEDTSVNHNDASASWFESDFSDGDYSIAVIPDTQNLISYYPEKLNSQMNWIKEHADELNIKLAVQVGDLVNSNGNQTEWTRIQNALGQLDGVVPYVFVMGNHDTSVRDTAMFNKNFPYSKYSAQESFQGAYEEGKMDNTYSFFELGGVEFMTITLEPAPRAEVLEWANEIATAHPEKNIIVVTHVYMNYDGNRTNESSQDQPNYENNACTGDEIWENFASQHENIVMVLSGHVGYPDLVVRQDQGVHGNTVQQVLCDAQFFDTEMGGLGMIMLMSFHEDSDQVDVNWYSTDRNQFFREKNQFTMTVNLHKNGQEETVDTSSLELAIAMAEKMDQAQKENACYTQESWAAVENALAEAKALLKKEGLTQEEADDAFLKLMTACNMVESGVQKTGLRAVIEGAQEILADEETLQQYQEESVQAVRQALEQAVLVYNNADAQQTEVNEATNQLIHAVTALLAKTDGSRLEVLIQMAEKMLQREEIYTPESVEKLKNVLAVAKTVLADSSASQAETDNAYCRLAEAMTGLVRKGDKSELKNAIEQAENILKDSDSYVESSISGLQAVVDEARQVYNNENADVTEISNMVKKLLDEVLKARLLGDVDLNGSVDTQDSSRVLKYYAEKEELSQEQQEGADVNRDGSVDSLDAARILMYSAEKIVSFR